MYSRYHDRSDRPISLPEHYNGCAFSHRTDMSTARPAEELRRVEIGTPSVRETRSEEAPSMVTVPTEPRVEPQKEIFSFAPRLFPNAGHAFPFAHGVGFDEILLLGLIVLLAGHEESGQIVLWLALLLFCG